MEKNVVTPILVAAMGAMCCLACGGDEKAAADGNAAGAGQAASAKPAGNAAAGASAAAVSNSNTRRVEVATIGTASARVELLLPGEVEGSRDATLASALGGYVEKVFVANGDTVKKGQILVRVDATTHIARRSQARVELDAAERELKRAKSMGNAIARAALDQAESRYAAAKAGMATASIAVDRAVVRAPFSGTVANVDAEVGEVAPPGAPLLRLIQLDPAKVTVNVSDREVVALKEGMAATITTGAESKAHAGTISHINPAADQRTRAFKVDFEVSNVEGTLKPGMISTVRVSEEVAGDELIVPQDWIVTRLEGLGVFHVVDGVAKWQPVKLGNVVRDQVVIKDGIDADMKVIVRGHRELADGDMVAIAREGVCCKEGRVLYN